MQRAFLLAAFIVWNLFLPSPGAQAQFQNGGQSSLLRVPLTSQRAQITQRIGITDVTIIYHRPLVGGRVIWGKTVPYGEVWRGGANENTTIEFTDPVTIAGKPLPKGIYGLHMIPGENEWTIIFSKAYTAWGSFTYDQSEDALRVAARPQASDFHEALAYDFDSLKPDSALITLRWDKLAVPFEVAVNVEKTVEESLPAQLRGWPAFTWDAWDDAATYLLENKGNLQDALKYEERSIQTEERFENLITKSRILDALDKKDEATSARNTAIEQATVFQLHGYARLLQAQGKQDEAFSIYRMNVKKSPNNWLVHSELARMDCAKGDFDGAVKEMKLSAEGAPEASKPFMEKLVKRLEAKEDINKP
jgi:tetratricopeptide (TPR) repeat protein